MLEEVGSAVGLVGLGAGAGIDPHADRRGLRIGRVLGCDLRGGKELQSVYEAVASSGRTNWHDVMAARLWTGGREGRGGAHSQAILECRRLGLEGGRVRCRKASSDGDRKTSRAATQALGEVQSKSPGRHGRGWVCVGGVEGRLKKMSSTSKNRLMQQ